MDPLFVGDGEEAFESWRHGSDVVDQDVDRCVSERSGHQLRWARGT
jgi:hypothetical protein